MRGILIRGTPVAEVEFYVFSSIRSTNADMESEAFWAV